MPGPTATAGVVGLPCSSATNHRDSGAEHQGSCSHVQNPPEVPPCPRGDAGFLERGAAPGGVKNSSEIRMARQWPKRKVLFRRVYNFLADDCQERRHQVQGMSAYCAIAVEGLGRREVPNKGKVTMKSSVLNLSALSSGLWLYYFRI
jgi:hypothetical protein